MTESQADKLIAAFRYMAEGINNLAVSAEQLVREVKTLRELIEREAAKPSD